MTTVDTGDQVGNPRMKLFISFYRKTMLYILWFYGDYHDYDGISS